MSAPAEVGRGFAGWWLRVVVLVAGAGAVAIQAAGGLAGVIVGILAVLVALAAGTPATPAPALVIAGIAVAGAALDSTTAAIAGTVVLLYLLHVTAALAAVVPAGARVSPRALVAPAWRFLGVLGVVLVTVSIVAFLPGAHNTPALEVSGLVGTTALVVLVLRLTRRGS